MTEWEENQVERKAEAISQLFIEFDGQQLIFTSDVPAAIDYFRRNYSLMLVPALTDGIGELKVLRHNNGYLVQGSIELDHQAEIDSLFHYLRREVLLLFISARSDLLWLHSGAVERDGSALLISGSSGRGKSTFVTQLCARGWKLLSDEAAPIRMKTREVLPFPQMARRRVYPGRHFELSELGSFEFEEIEVAPADIRRQPARISGIVFPYFQIGASAALERLSAGEGALEIIRNLTNFVDHKSVAVSEAAMIASNVPCYKVTYSDGRDAAALVDSLH